MGTLGDGNGGGRPPDNGGRPEGLPDLPPEWGTVVIPDDPAALAPEAEEVRRQLRRLSRRNRWRRRFGLPLLPPGTTQPSLGLPLLIMAVAVMATLTSLFVVTWPGRTERALVDPDASSAAATHRPVPDLTLTDSTGAPVHLPDVVPAVIMLIDGCPCAELVAATAEASAPGVTVLTVDRTAPPRASATAASYPAAGPAPAPVRALADPEGRLRTALKLGQPGGAAGIALVGRDGMLVHTLPAARTVDDFRTQLATLG
ncbi:MAG TPA: hypothetical protein VFM54_23090 [Micromonosporaceae bacterium]|nr:hypothetical protein [Micromonosporaceae bacterium]